MGSINVDELAWTSVENEDGETQFKRKQLGEAAGSDEIGCSLYELPAGSRSWPYHYHTGNEEALFVLEGTGTLRLDGETHRLTDGEFVALPADERGAHRVVNDTEGPLRYVMVSTMNEPDVTVYPDSEKLGVFVGSPPGSSDPRHVHGYYRLADDVEYWTDEPNAE
ncbi:cupin domain-containing protein [Halopiger djelfimassiliensis]|uniref:cupin domain-containing protein n=1 Tax=Halopiger djelfimassiliensis TaxID=1293047 RepID=UPI000677E2CA|nr:cupin domain-containing protein [Halopiger djelfimassiliensis]